MPSIPVIIVAVFFFSGGLSHFVLADFFVKAMPSYLPYHLELVQISGIFELLGAIGILVPKTRLYAAHGLMCLCIAVFPANINMAVNAHLFTTIPAFLLYLRLPLQILIIWFIWWSVSDKKGKKEDKVVDGSFKSQKDTDLENFCREFSSAFAGLLSWRWDPRFDTVLAEFGVDKEEKIHAILEKHLSNIWDSTNIGSVPKISRMINESMGKLKPGQLLFTSDPHQEAFIYCVLWPWGNKKTISIRIAPSYVKMSAKEKEIQIEHLKAWFNIDESGQSNWIKLPETSPFKESAKE